MRKFNILAVISIFILNWTYGYAENVDDSYKIEIKNIQNSSIKKHGNLFFIELFGGAFPIPSRFEITNYINNKLILESPIHLWNNPTHTLIEGNNFTGGIEVGRYIKKDNPKYRTIESRIKLIKSKNVKNLSISIYKEKLNRSASLNDFYMVYIHDQKEYIRITDKNIYLWEALVNTFFRINEKQKTATN